ncbi:glycosyltransferase family 2 protein [Pontibacter kalidii]|uniref:glycosyltransferase family 2 protein n=1 Tax=Pontibacter kalidii TaxID=2592049 RepID=UPI00224C8216|nr:glycosyltransferase family A protein [Pontibacter kalidii]
MQQQPLYKITHIHLDQLDTPLHTLYTRPGSYLVFWWDSIALGHMFIEPGHQLTQEEYHDRLIEAIKPAVKVYIRKAHKLGGCWQHLLADGKTEEWLSLMASFFTTSAADKIPARVPVSVVICTRNRANHLHKCLSTLHQLRCLPEEIVVVDNAPSDDATKNVVALFRDVRYVRELRPGLSNARNTGIQTASHPIIAFTDDDVTVHPDWVYRVWQTFEESNVAAMTGLVIVSELQTEAQLIFEKHWSFNRGYADVLYDAAYFSTTLPFGPPVWKIGAGANMAFRRTIFEEVGLFHQELGAGASGCSEDSEMWFRILAHGHTIHYNPRAAVFHEHRKEFKELKKQIYYYMRGFTAAALFQQHQHHKANYKKHLSKVLPKHYLRMIIRGFPRYRSRLSTVWVEVQGMLSGLVYYHRNRSRFSKPSPK